MSKICNLCEEADVSFGIYKEICTKCRNIKSKLRADGYSVSDAEFKIKCGFSYEGKVKYWNIKIKEYFNG